MNPTITIEVKANASESKLIPIVTAVPIDNENILIGYGSSTTIYFDEIVSISNEFFGCHNLHSSPLNINKS